MTCKCCNLAGPEKHSSEWPRPGTGQTPCACSHRRLLSPSFTLIYTHIHMHTHLLTTYTHFRTRSKNRVEWGLCWVPVRKLPDSKSLVTPSFLKTRNCSRNVFVLLPGVADRRAFTPDCSSLLADCYSIKRLSYPFYASVEKHVFAICTLPCDCIQLELMRTLPRWLLLAPRI